MRANGKKTRKTDRVLWYGPTSQNMKASGKMTHVTERGTFYYVNGDKYVGDWKG